jgi:hypothetical protein
MWLNAAGQRERQQRQEAVCVAMILLSLGVIVDKKSLGWKSDAHKNLPGFKLLYDAHPNADWFIMLDDDTFMLFENLVDYLDENFPDPDAQIYLGNPNRFIGCDGVTKMGKGPGFAHGGSGIVLSRGAMRVLVANIDACISRYKTCWAGDVRTALCLRDNDIRLETKVLGYAICCQLIIGGLMASHRM